MYKNVSLFWGISAKSRYVCCFSLKEAQLDQQKPLLWSHKGPFPLKMPSNPWDHFRGPHNLHFSVELMEELSFLGSNDSKIEYHHIKMYIEES